MLHVKLIENLAHAHTYTYTHTILSRFYSDFIFHQDTLHHTSLNSINIRNRNPKNNNNRESGVNGLPLII